MELDESKIYTLVNAYEVEVGSTGIFADCLSDLSIYLRNAENYCKDELCILKGLRSDSYSSRFFNGKDYYPIFYLLEEPKKEDTYQPYHSISEFLDDYCHRFNMVRPIIGYPPVWLDIGNDNHLLVIGYDFDDSKLLLSNSVWCSLDWMFEHYAYLDGTKCGIKIEED